MSDIKQYEPLWGSWYVDSLLGEGSFGKVYKVHKEEFGKTYEAAVKMISIPQGEADLRQAQNDGLDTDSARSYFHAFVTDIIQEIDLMSAFRGNSNIVSLEDHKVIEKKGEIGWDIIIRMELLTTLSSHVTAKPMTEADVVKLGVHICRALELCAVRKTIHRDIKPDNIFVSQYGEYKLGDFGIARQIERTMSGLSKKGTYTYMAPEVFKGGEYGASVDIYSLGIVMYRFLNKNRAPFLPAFPDPITPHDRDEALQRRMSGEDIPPITDIDPALNDIVLKACAYSREDRFKSAAEMRAALESLSGFCPDFLDSPVTEEPHPEDQRHRPEPTERTRPQSWAAPDDDERTKGVFSLRHEAPKQDLPQASEEPEVPAATLNRLSLFSGLCMAALAVLCFFSGERDDLLTFLPVYALCAAQCAVKFRFKLLNVVTLMGLVCYVMYATLVDFRSFDYAFLAAALGFLSIDVARSGKRGYQILLCAGMAGYAAASTLMIIHALRGVVSETHYAYVAGSVGIPLLLVMAAPAGMMLGWKDESFGQAGRGLSVLSALQCFSLVAFALLFALASSSGSGVLFHAANSNFITFLSDRFPWWRAGRVFGLLFQTAAFEAMLALAVAQGLPAVFLGAFGRGSRGKFFGTFALTVAILVVGLFAVSFLAAGI